MDYGGRCGDVLNRKSMDEGSGIIQSKSNATLDRQQRQQC